MFIRFLKMNYNLKYFWAYYSEISSATSQNAKNAPTRDTNDAARKIEVSIRICILNYFN